MGLFYNSFSWTIYLIDNSLVLKLTKISVTNTDKFSLNSDLLKLSMFFILVQQTIVHRHGWKCRLTAEEKLLFGYVMLFIWLYWLIFNLKCPTERSLLDLQFWVHGIYFRLVFSVLRPIFSTLLCREVLQGNTGFNLWSVLLLGMHLLHPTVTIWWQEEKVINAVPSQEQVQAKLSR